MPKKQAATRPPSAQKTSGSRVSPAQTQQRRLVQAEPGRTLANGDLLRIQAITRSGLTVRRALDADPHTGQRRSATQTRNQALADAHHLALLHAIWTAETTPARDQRCRDLLMSILPAGDRREPSHRCLRRSGAPGTVGGRRCCRGPAPDPARCLPLGHLVAGLLQQHARVEARSKGNFLCSQPRASSCREGCRERRLWALPRPSRPAGRSSFSYRPAGRPPQGASRAARGAKGVRGTPLPFLPAWRSSAPSDVLARYQDFSNPD